LPEAETLAIYAYACADAGLLQEAEENFRKALSLEPDNPVRFNSLAYLLINHDLNVDEGLELIEKALELRPDNFIYLNTKGLGLYKQGKYREALEVLQKSWDLRRNAPFIIMKHS
jgi:tetratricopeptide (TPR) repeat protein